MKIKLLLLLTIIAIAAQGCLKDTKQPVSHINDVNVSLIGSWTQIKSSITYYDSVGKKLYEGTPQFIDLKFNGKSTVTETSEHGLTTLNGDYNISTSDNADYINTTVGSGSHTYQISALHNRDLTLIETINYPGDSTLTVGAKSVIYNKTVQVNIYAKKDLPSN